MQVLVFQGILIPFLGTALGSACVLFMKKSLNSMLQRALMKCYNKVVTGLANKIY